MFPLLAILLASLPAATSLTCAVFGGTGFIGSRVCKHLALAGCNVVSVSRSGAPPRWAADEDWTKEVRWVAADAMDPGATLDAVRSVVGAAGVDSAVSCIGNITPSTAWDGFWGLHWDDEEGYRDNGLLNLQAINAAHTLGAKNFSFLSLSSDMAHTLDGPLEGFVNGKWDAEAAAVETFGSQNCLIVGPSVVYGGARFPTAGKLLSKSLRNAIIDGYKSFVERNEDWVTKTALTSPANVDDVARVAAAGALGTLGDIDLPPRPQTFFKDRKPYRLVEAPFVDGTLEIERVAATAGSDDALRLAANENSEEVWTKADDQLLKFAPQHPLEGLFVGFKPLLYPIPVATTMAMSFLWAISVDHSKPLPTTLFDH